MQDRHELILVSNRLPVDYTPDDNGAPGWSTSPGGLVTALQPVAKQAHGVWVGWPGIADLEVEPFTHDGVRLLPIALSGSELEEFYEGFANATLWPLCHDLIAAPQFDRRWWESYSEVNRRFAEAAAGAAAPGATVWVHDYHLMLVPRLLRDLRPDVRIGYFHHIPFPEYGMFAQLPWRRQLVEGVLGCDVIGFQRGGDARNFLRAVRQLLHLPTQGAVINVPDGSGSSRNVLARSFPISVDAEQFTELARNPAVVARAAEIRAELGHPAKLILGVDRLDYTKGIGHRLAAFGELLTEGRLPANECVLVQVASPSRERVGAYQQLRDEVELAVGRINGEQSTLGHQPVVYLHQSFDRAELVALYLAADVMLITALRDGMNLVAKEYVASRVNTDGVLVLSEFAGAGDELRQAIKVNPHDIDALKQAIVDAVGMPHAEQSRRMRVLRRTVRQHDVARWADTFLGAIGARSLRIGATDLPAPLRSAVRNLANAPRVLIALDFDGTLAPFACDPARVTLPQRTRSAITALVNCRDTTVAIISGRGLDDLRTVAGLSARVRLIGSHGAEMPGASVAPTAGERASLDALTSLFEAEAATHPGAWVEPKPFGAALHVRGMPRAAGDRALGAARAALSTALPEVHLQRGHRVLEAAVRAGNKGWALGQLRSAAGGASVVFIGDDATDEDAFQALLAHDLGVKVGDGITAAAHRVADPDEVAALLELLAAERVRRRDGRSSPPD